MPRRSTFLRVVSRASVACRHNLPQLHRGFDGLSERTVLHLSTEMRRWSAQSVLADPPTCAAQQVGSYLGYSGRALTHSGRQLVRPKQDITIDAYSRFLRQQEREKRWTVLAVFLRGT
jgi:hypothetical protein